jgi:hypothetical protein
VIWRATASGVYLRLIGRPETCAGLARGRSRDP